MAPCRSKDARKDDNAQRWEGDAAGRQPGGRQAPGDSAVNRSYLRPTERPRRDGPEAEQGPGVAAEQRGCVRGLGRCAAGVLRRAGPGRRSGDGGGAPRGVRKKRAWDKKY